MADDQWQVQSTTPTPTATPPPTPPSDQWQVQTTTPTPTATPPPTPQNPWYKGGALPHELGELNTGFTSALSQTGLTAEKGLAMIPGVMQHTKLGESMKADVARASQPMNTPGRMAGNAIENIIEFASGDEALKGASMLTKINELKPLAEALKKSPILTRIMGNAVRQGTVGTTQQLAHGSDLPTALKTGATMAAGGAALEGVIAAGEKAASAIKGGAAKAIPPATEIAGRQIPGIAEGAPGTVQAAQQATQQTEAQAALGNVATRATNRVLQPYGQNVNHVTSFDEAAQHIAKAATTDYDELSARASLLRGEDVGAKVKDLNQAVSDSGTNMGKRAAAKEELFNYLDSIDDPRYPDSLRDIATRARNTSKMQFMAEDLHKIANAYSHASPESAAAAGEPYTLNAPGEPGQDMMGLLRNFEQDYGRQDAQQLLGKDGLDNLYKIAKVTGDATHSQNADNILMQVLKGAHQGQKGKWIAGGMLGEITGMGFVKGAMALKSLGAAKGGAEAAMPYLKYQIATNPRLGNLLTYAARKGVSTPYASKLLSLAIYREMADAEQERQTTQTPLPQDTEVVPANPQRGIQSVTLPTRQGAP
jgi:hypothetical protein